MKRIFVIFLCACGAGSAQFTKKPKLVVAIAVDQFRADYLTRFRKDFTGGFDRLLTKGAVFTNARYEQFPTVTAIGHSTFLSGATPSISGIIGNEWWDREAGKKVTSVSDDTVKTLGATGEGSSPRRLLVSTVGDEMRMADPKAKVIGVSLKDRASILPSGHMANGAYWFDSTTGGFISSSFYFPDLPGWVKDFNANRPADHFAGMQWMGRTFVAAGPKLYASLPASPWGNELIEAFAERALQAENLGKGPATDLLTVSFSSNDYVGHELGPDSPEVRDISLRTDKVLEKFFGALDAQVGLDNTLIVLTADHGVTSLPEVNQKRGMPGGRMTVSIPNTVQASLEKKYGAGKWVLSPAEYSIYLNWDLIDEKKLDRAEVSQTAAEALRQVPHIFRVYTREQLRNGAALEDQVGRRVMNGYYARRGADITILLEPYWIFAAHGTTHGTTFNYDAHVPVIFMGAGIKHGTYYQGIAINDIAPTLTAILGLEIPSGSVGRVLSEIFTD